MAHVLIYATTGKSPARHKNEVNMSIDNERMNELYLKAPGIRFSACLAATYRENGAEAEGFSSAMKGLQLLGLLGDEPHPSLHPRGPEITWRQFMTTLLGQQDNLLTSNIKNLIYERVDKCELRTKAIEDLGLIDDIPVEKKNTPLQTLIFHLSNRLAYEPGERDLVIMRHDIGIQWHDEKKEVRHVDMVTYGDPNGYSAMAKTVGYPAAIAAKMILQGEIQAKGMVLPFAQEIYGPMLQRLKNEGIRCRETTSKNYS